MARPRLISDEQILASMRACVVEGGPAVSLEVVATELGVTAPALLKRFGSRQELMLRSLRPPEHHAVFQLLKAGPSQGPLELQLAELLQSLWSFLAEAVPCVAALRESGISHEKIFDSGSSPPLRLMKALALWLRRAHRRRLVDVCSEEAAATAMLGAVQTRVLTAHLLKRPPSARARQRYLQDLTAFFARALAPKGHQEVSR